MNLYLYINKIYIYKKKVAKTNFICHNCRKGNCMHSILILMVNLTGEKND